MSCRASILALAALWLASPQLAIAATSMTNPVTGETESYENIFSGGTEWNSSENWDTGNTPFISGNYDPALVTNNTVSTSTAIDGWTLRVGAYSGASVTWSGGIKKIQGGSTGCWLTADETSSITIASFGGAQLEGGDSAPFKLSSANAGGITWSSGLTTSSNTSLPFWYYLKGKGTVVYGGDITVANAQVIKQADITLSGTSQVISKRLVTFGSGTTASFSADAVIKRLNSSGVDLKKNANIYTVNTTGSTTLMTSDDVGKCELVKTSTGIDLYWVDGDPDNLPKTVYKPSISVNFTNGEANGLTTVEAVGLDGYAVPGTSWNNYPVANSTFSTVNSTDSNGVASVESGVSVTISNSSGRYSCSALTPANNPLYGYIDENAGNPNPTVTVAGIPYYKYRVIVYHSTDTANVPFGYDTINGVNYTYSDNVLTAGTAAWGNSGAKNSANAILEGTNTLVTGELSGSTLTVVGHRAGDASNARGCIAAIQIIEVKPEITADDLEIPVSGETQYTVSEAKNLSGTVYLTGNGTLTLDGSAKITAATINVGPSVVLNINADRLDGTTFTGEGTVVYDGVLPTAGKGWTDSAWTGTVWLKNYGSGGESSNVGVIGTNSNNADNNVMNGWGNAGSSVKFTNVRGWCDTGSLPWTLILEDDGSNYAWYNNNGYSARETTFASLRGTGTLYDTGNTGCRHKITFTDASGFSGAFNVSGKRIGLGGSSTAPNNANGSGSIEVVSGKTATVASGKTWTAGTGGFRVYGTLNDNGTLATDAEMAVRGTGTVVFGGIPSPIDGESETKWWKNTGWTGTVEISGVSGIDDSYAFSDYGNAGSTVKLTDCRGWLKPNYTCVPALEIGGTFSWNDGYSGLNNTFKVGTLKGSGTISIPNQGAETAVWQITDDWSGFTGAVIGNNDGARRVLVFGSTLPASIVKGEIYVSEGATLNLDNSSSAWWGVGMGFVVDGTVKASSRSKWGGGTYMTLGDTGVLELTSTDNTEDYNNYSGVTGTGTIKYSSTKGWRTFPDQDANMPATTLTIQVELADSLILPTKNNGETVIGNLAGSKNIRSDWSPNGSNGRILTVTQSKDTEWSGKFVSNRITQFNVVAPTEGTPGTLTLSGTQTTSIPMRIDGSVRLTGTWVGDTTVNGAFGGTGKLTGNLTFNAGSCLKVFGINEDGFEISGTIVYPTDDSKIQVDLSALDLQKVGDEIPLFKATADEPNVDTDKFELVDKKLMFDFVFENNVLSLKRNNDIADSYSDSVELTLNNIGSTPITDYTLLVRISMEQFPGFSYERAGDGSKIAFMDSDGRSLSYEVDTWNTHGESLVWVKVPGAVDGKKVIFYWSLKDGKSAPENHPEEVWSGYAGVWHMDDATDSSGNSADGTPHEKAVKRSDGKFGGAYGRTENGVKGPIATIPRSNAMDALTDGAFTVSAWVRLNSASGLNYPYFFSRKDENATAGWGVQLDGHSSSSSTKIWANGSNGISFSPAYKANEWVHMSVVFANGSSTMFVDGVQYGPTANASFVPATDTTLDFYIGGARADDTGAEGGRTNTLNGDMDEVRLYKGAVSAAHAKAEYSNALQTDFLNAADGDGVSFLVPGIVMRDGEGVDYWVKEPTISPSHWSSTAAPSVVYAEGVLRSGSSVTNWCENLLTGEKCAVSSDILRALPAGTYRIHCETKGVFAVSEKTVDFTVVEESGITSVGDTAGGRILLMNNDFSKGGDAATPSISCQGYSDTNTEASVFWGFLDSEGSSLSTMNIMAGKNSILWSVNESVTNKLWHLVDCRHGNTFPAGAAGLSDNQNYLPYSDASCSITNGAVAVGSSADAGQLLMLNTTDAAVYSPCYEEGIGTIYFDAVNGWNNNIYSYGVSEGDTNAYQIIVEYATNTTDGAAVTDSNLWMHDDSEVVTNYYGNLDPDCWHACKSHVIRVTGGNTLLEPETFTGEFGLAVESGRPTTTGEFYRVYADLDIRVPVRFRIRRASMDSEVGAADANAYVILDNIIVSYPAMGATLETPGRYDNEKRGAGVLGFESAFTTPFPAVGETLYGRAVANYYVNSSTNLTETNFFASAKMYYRWRYLNQPSPDGWEWKSVALDPERDFQSSEKLVLPNDVGDVEFWYEYVLQAPYYSYVDYSGLDLASDFAAIYSEAITGPQTNRSAKIGFSYPSCGNDWFVRLRAGASSNEVWRIFMRNIDGSFYDADGNGSDHVDFAITESGSWRGFVRTPNPVAAGLEYRIEQINPRTDVENFTFSTNYWKGGAEFTDSIKSVNLSAAASTNEWSTVPCAGSTSYLMFVIDESSPALSVTSADRQDFNSWNDANKNEILFVGSSSEDGDSKKAGVSPGMRVYDANFEDWTACPATNDKYWSESFVENWTRYTKFATTNTPNGWTSGSGMWVYEKYKDDSNSQSMALQMQGRGEGYLAFTGAVENPRGIESISFRSRIAQSVSLGDFAVRDEGVGRSHTNYCFIVQGAMSTNSVTSGGAWDSRFDGLGQLSVLGGYRKGIGGYELRITRWKERRYRAELCKWVGNICEVVNQCEANLSYAQMPYTIINGSEYPTLFISVDYQSDGSCKVLGGFSYSEGTGTGHSSSGILPNTGKYLTMSFWDDAPPKKSEDSPWWGSYGVASANCDAVFTGARFCNKAAGEFDSTVEKGARYSNRFKKADCSAFNPSEGTTPVSEDVGNDWAHPSRLKYDSTAKKLFAVADAQPLLVQWRRPNESDNDWKTIDTVTVSSYTLSELNTINLLLKEDAYIRLKHGGDSSDDSNCVDIVVDDVTLRQWRGDDYSNIDTQTSFDNLRYASPSNFVFTSAWIHEEGSVELSTARTPADAVSSLRSPLMDGRDGRGVGLGMFSFSYTNADSRASLLLQIAKDIDVTVLPDYTTALADTSWTTVTNFDFSVLSDDERAGGVMSYYLGMHGVKGVMRLVVNPATIADAEASGDPEYGRVFVTDAICRDEPNLDAKSWWGWNLRTGRGLYDADDMMLASLADWPGSGLADAGMSFALNNSTVDDTLALDSATYNQHQPFLQTPAFTNGTTVGEISLKARRYDMPSEITARVCVYGANPLSEHVDTTVDKNWKYVTHFDVTNDYYQTYTFKAKADKSYEVLRLVVVGVAGVGQEHGRHYPANPEQSDPGYADDKPVVRIAIDDVVVTEALRPKLAFKNVFAFRGDGLTDLLNTHYVDRFGDKTAQPLAGEGWGVQAEVYAEQLPDEIDFDRGVSVKLYWYDGGIDPNYWGADKWMSNENSAKLAPCDDKDLAFRSSFNDGHSGRSVLGQMSEYEGGTTVQYMLRVEYYLKGSEEPTYNDMMQEQWVKPYWYRGIDYNADYDGFSAYTILDTVSPGWAWINEVNVFGGYNSFGNNADEDMQYVEIAMPVEADLTGWRLEFISKYTNNIVCTFGEPGIPSRKQNNASANCSFLVISSPSSKSNLETQLTVGGEPVQIDGTWRINGIDRWNFLDYDKIDVLLDPIGVQLVRPSGIVEHAITFEGTNLLGSAENSAAYFAETLNAKTPGAGWVAVGDDSIEGDHSLGVTGRPADVAANWSNTMARTPGFINEGQTIHPVHPVANGSTYIVYATFAADSAGHMTQTLGTDVDTTSLAMAVVRKGFSTNITYNVDNWFELASVKVNGEELPLTLRTGNVPVTLGGEATSNNLTVVASSCVTPTLESAWGLDANNRYTTAVVEWLCGGRTLRRAFANPAGPLASAQFMPLSLKADDARDLTLTEMYWLDIDPTADYNADGTNDWWLVGGMKVAPTPKIIDDPPLTNIIMGACLYITNAAPAANGGGDSFAPYVLRGAKVGSVSTSYSSGSVGAWDGPTYRIIGRLFEQDSSGEDDNGLIEWVPLRWFVFNDNSFWPKGASNEFQSSIEIVDPYSSESAAFTRNWDERRGTSNIFYTWAIDDGGGLSSTTVLCPTNWLSK